MSDEDDFDPFAALAAAREAGKPENLLFDAEGVTHEGIVVSVSVATSDYTDAATGQDKKYPVVVIKQRDGKLGIIRAFHTAMQDIGSAQPGDALSVTYTGVSDKVVKGRKPANLYNVFCVRNGQQVILPSWSPQSSAIAAYVAGTETTDAGDLRPF